MVELRAVDQLIAVEAIRSLKARYFRFLDSQEWDALQAIFTVDAHITTGLGEFVRAAEFVAEARASFVGGRTIHHGHMPEIEIISPTTATGIWALHDLVEFPPHAPRRYPASEREEQGEPLRGFQGYGRYWERYVMERDAWKISEMRIERLRIIANP